MCRGRIGIYLGAAACTYPLEAARTSGRLLRAGVAAKRLGCGAQFNTAVFRCIWAGNEDLMMPKARAHLLTANRVGVPTLWDDAAMDWTEKALDENNVETVEQGVFGVPTIFADDEIFFCNDRLPLIRKKAGAGSIAAGAPQNTP